MLKLRRFNQPYYKLMMKKLFFALLLLCSPMLFADETPPAIEKDATETKPSYTFAIYPDKEREDLVVLWQPVIDYLLKATDLDVQLVIPESRQAFDEELTKQAYDISYATPYQYVKNEKHYAPILRQQDKNTQLVLFGNQHHSIKTLAELDQQVVIFINENASAIPLHYLQQANANIKPRYIKNQATIYRTIALGLADYATGDLHSFEQLRPSLQAKLSVIWESPAYTGAAIMVKQELAEVQAVLIKALLDWSNTPKGLRHLKRLQLESLILANTTDWDDIREVMPAIAKAAAANPPVKNPDTKIIRAKGAEKSRQPALDKLEQELKN